jgi:methylated-DNA-protein-cysteine methyltransferase related protein
MAKAKKEVTQATLRAVTPSGKREQSFYELVYDVARQIPKGRVTSYGAIAACLGAKKSARMVGWAMNNAHYVKPAVPAHRVVNSKGLLSGRHHFKPDGQMERLLKREGVTVEEGSVKDFEKKFWDPSTELA